MAWNYQRDESSSFKPIPEGAHRIRIAKAEMAKASTGKDMLVLEFDVSGYSSKIFHNIVFLPDRPEITNRNLTQFFNSFKDIPEGDFTVANYVGKVGACQVKHEEYNGNTNAKVKFFIAADKAANLAPWKEPEKKADSASAPASGDGFMNVSQSVMEEVPF